MVFDVDKLKEAADILNSATGIKLLLTRKHDVVREVITAVRMVAAGQPLRRCETHNSEVPDDLTNHCRVVAFTGWSAVPCRMVEGWWMPTGKDAT